MRIILTIIICITAFTLTNAQQHISSKEITKKKENGIEKIYYNNQLYSGAVTDSYENGKPKSWISVDKGIIDGLWQEWYENGQLRFNAYWKAGKGHGLWQYFHENGVLRQEEFYDLDRATGIFREFYNNGQVAQKSSWLLGKKHGIWQYYDSAGILEKTETYQHNELISTKENKK
ncbi:MORN repeat protein [Kordia periserrulae]|uniref:MORN repeat protein n=1 Tax=Kordia periserrulae TaxID=701523 RepID=A0A2T6BZN9_9FLAO|nr:toxin-antitoxin system YwqK family antitoxin [Kordia periserrulae]PTX61457.1 MORN repeat protein [Kordia periserrulae]